MVDVSFLKGKGGLVDRSGNQRVLKHVGGDESDITESGIHFNGADDYLTIKNFDYAGDGTFTISFWFKKEKCTQGAFEYLYSDHAATGSKMWSTPYLDVYMGCVDEKKSKSGGGSIMRYWMRDTAGQEALFDWPLADADSFDSITKTWIHIMLVVSPSAIRTYEDGKVVPEKQYQYEPKSLPNSKNLASGGPGKLKPSFKAGQGTKKIFDFPMDIHIGGRADHDGRRRFLGHMALLKVFAATIGSSDAMCLFETGEALLIAATSDWDKKESSPPPAKAKAVTPVVTQMSTSVDSKHVTYRLSVKLGSTAANVYTIYGDETKAMYIPKAYQVKSPFGQNFGGVNPKFYALRKEARFDSWLTVGLTEGDGANTLGTIGMHVAKWNETQSLVVDDGAVFWMNPANGPTSSTVVLAQLTVAKDAQVVAVMNVAGRSKTKRGKKTKDYHQFGLKFKLGQ
eukprot:COSAG05_NODE_56_length_23335_cov_15.221338_5_plen_454_part_00